MPTDDRKHRSPFASLSPFEPESEHVRVVIETPKGSRNKFKFDEELGLFRLGSVLPAGAVFPYDFGYLPGTLADDGDPLDVLVLMDAPAFYGCVVTCRLIGVIEAEQISDGNSERNDRLVAVAIDAHDYADWKSLKHVNPHLLKELEYFFVSYNELRGKEFRLLGHRGPSRARELADLAVHALRRAEAG